MLPIRDTIPRQNPPITTWILMLINSVVFVVELSMPQRVLDQLFYLFGMVPARYTHLEWAALVGFPVDDFWPFLTSMFLHGGWLHIITNMWALWIFGDNVEDRMGPVRFLIFYLLCGLIAGITHWFMNSDSTIPTVGASGAIAGVMGAYFILFPRSRVIVLLPILFIPLFFELPAIVYLGIWLFSQLFSGTLSVAATNVAGIAWWAHVGGFIAGMLLHFLFIRQGREYRLPSRDEYGIEGAWLPQRYWRDNP
jgi:membrane associated rhomboid family serine protease